MNRPVRLQEMQRQRQAILAIADRHGATNVRIFGSVARDEARVESDIDFLVEMRQNHSPWFPSGLRLDLQDLLGQEVDVVTERMLDTDIRPTVLREAIPL
jgi:predicted nucleotidyltransferase